MDHEKNLAVYKAQVRNTRVLETSMTQLRRSINRSLRNNDTPGAIALTKLYALAFCAWAEANFSKVVHTPYGFAVDEIRQVNSEKRHGIAAAWNKAVDLGIRHLDARRGNFLPNTRQKLRRAIESHVFDPSLLRNKLAHGQWVEALNRENTAIDQKLTQMIESLDVVKIDGWRTCHKLLAEIVENLVESPRKAFIRDWWIWAVQLDEAMARAMARTLSEHIRILKAKDARTLAQAKRHGAL